MGEPKFSRPKYDTPSHPWKADRIEEEHAIRASHGLKNMKKSGRPSPNSAATAVKPCASSVTWTPRKDTASVRWRTCSIPSPEGPRDCRGQPRRHPFLGVEEILNRRLQAQVYYKACQHHQAGTPTHHPRTNRHR